MIADLALLGEPYGVLLFAFLSEASGGAPQRLAPTIGADQTLTPQEVVARQLRPTIGAEVENRGDVHDQLRALLDDAHARLATPRVPACHGIFLDALSVRERIGVVDRYGAAIGADAEELLICPKPHIGAWRVDLVSRARHCCQDARLCHIVGQPLARPPVRPPRSTEELLRELQHIFERADDGEFDDESVSAIARQVEAVSRQFAHIKGIAQRMGVYEQRVRDMGMDQAFDRLGKLERESLALAFFLVEQLDEIGAQDFSAPAIHLSSVMELEIQRRVFACPGLVGHIAEPRNQTLGKLPWMRREPELTEGNWNRITAYVAAHWNEQIDPEDPTRTVTFDILVARALSRISQLRNQAAHTHPVSRKEYGELQRIMLQTNPLPCGALTALVHAWRTIL